MWYGLLDTQRRLAKAFADSALNICQSGCDEWAAAMPRASRDWLVRATCAFDTAPPFAIAAVRSGGEWVPVEECVADEMAIGTLRKFTRAGSTAIGPVSHPVLLCAPLAGHHAVMLRETVETLLETRGTVYITDWADARDVPLAAGPLALTDYVCSLERFIRTVWACGERMHIVAICQACVPALAAASLLASSEPHMLDSVALLGGPIDTRLHQTSVDRFAKLHSLQWFRDNVIDVVPPPYRGAGRRVYPGFIQQAAIMAAHPGRQLELEALYWSNWFMGRLRDAQSAHRSLNEYAAVLDMSELYFLDMLRVVFQEHLLTRGAWAISGRYVDTGALAQVPLCTIEGDRDDITGTGQTHCAHALCHAPDAPLNRWVTVDQCDHYDLFTGSRWRNVVHPVLREYWRAVECASETKAGPATGIQ
jgi:polyhydroxyalkanoate depolymerase